MSQITGFIPIDLVSALERTGGEMDFLEELIEMFIVDFKEKYIVLKEAVNQEDAVQVQEIAHSLKGSSANLGLLPLQETFFQLETAGRNNDFSDLDKKIELLQVQFDELIIFWENRNQIGQEVLSDKNNQFSEAAPAKTDPEMIKIDESILDLIPTYLENRKSDIETINTALGKKDMSTIESIAHKMKGSGASYGFEEISRLGQQIESCVQQKDLDEIRLLIDELDLFLENVQYG